MAKAKRLPAVSRVKTLAVNTARANAGLINDIIDATIDQWIDGADFETCLTGAQSQLADAALNRHGDKVRAALSRAGLDLPTESLSAGLIAQAVSAKSGIDFGDFSPSGVLAAIDGMLARRLSEVTGIEIASVWGNDLPTTIKVALRASLRAGHGKHIIGVIMERRARQMATLKRLGSDRAELKKLKNRAYQAEYRKHNKLVWA